MLKNWKLLRWLLLHTQLYFDFEI